MAKEYMLNSILRIFPRKHCIAYTHKMVLTTLYTLTLQNMLLSRKLEESKKFRKILYAALSYIFAQLCDTACKKKKKTI